MLVYFVKMLVYRRLPPSDLTLKFDGAHLHIWVEKKYRYSKRRTSQILSVALSTTAVPVDGGKPKLREFSTMK